MRFAALQGSGASDYIAAGKNAADSAAKSFEVTRKYGPKYDEIAKTGMQARSAERRTAMEAEASVTQAAIKAVGNVKQTQLREQGKADVEKVRGKVRKAGAIAGLGKLAAAGYLASRDNTKGRKRPSNTDAMRALYADYVKNRDRTISDSEASRTTFTAPEYKPGDEPSLTDPSKLFGGPITADSLKRPASAGSGSTGGKVTKGALGSSLTGNQKTVADAIAKYESGSWGYEAFNQGGAAGGTRVVGKSGSHKEHFGTSLTDLTLAEIFKRQNTKQRGMSMQQHLDSGGLHAVGRYQFIGSTLQDEVKRMGLDPNTTKFTPQVQDQIFINHIKRVGNISPWVGPSNNYSAGEKANFRNMISGF